MRNFDVAPSEKAGYFVVSFYDDAKYILEISWEGTDIGLVDEIKSHYESYLARAKASVHPARNARENAYNTEPRIDFDGDVLTVTEAAQLWQYYAAEDSEKAVELTRKIAAAKAEIREQYPD